MNFLRTVRVHRTPFDPAKGLLIAGGRIIRCALGRSGPTVFKREGDGATPANIVMRPVSGFFRQDRTHRPVSPLAFEALTATDGWCDEPGNPNYNSAVTLPIDGSHEIMQRNDRLYDIGVVLDWNMVPGGRKRHAGSAIFLHLCKHGYRPTEGCIAIDVPDMRWLLAHINRETRFTVLR